MIIEQGTVVGLDGSNALIAIRKNNICSQCASNQGCGMGLFAGLVGQRSAEIILPNGIGAKLGDQVKIGVPEKPLLKLAATTYLMPLLIMLLFGLFLESVFPAVSDGMITIFSMLGFALSLFFANYFSKKRNLDVSLDPKVIMINQRHEL